MKIDLPLKVLKYHRKRDDKDIWFHLNLNAFTQIAKCPSLRNKVKQNYQELITPLLANIKPIKGQISLTYTLYVGSKRRSDLSNICCIIDKYFSDTLVNAGIIEDDSYEYIKEVKYLYGGYDKENPRCEVEIKQV